MYVHYALIRSIPSQVRYQIVAFQVPPDGTERRSFRHAHGSLPRNMAHRRVLCGVGLMLRVGCERPPILRAIRHAENRVRWSRTFGFVLQTATDCECIPTTTRRYELPLEQSKWAALEYSYVDFIHSACMRKVRRVYSHAGARIRLALISTSPVSGTLKS